MTSTPASYTGSIFLKDDDICVDWGGGDKTPAGSGVYEIHMANAVKRLRGESTTLYIGRSGDLSARMKQLATWDHSVTLRLYDVLMGADIWGGADLSTRSLRIVVHCSADSAADPELEEVRRIATFEREHCELPPLNRTAPGYLPFLALQRIMEGLAGRLESLDKFGPKRLKVRKPWDHEGQAITFIDLAVDKAERISLAWTWPAAWCSKVQRPDWWPEGSMPYRSESLFLFVHSDWDARGHGPVRASIRWRKARNDEPWLGLDTAIPLSWELLSQAPDGLSSLLNKGVLGSSGKPPKPDLSMSDALRKVWGDLEAQLKEAAKVERAAAMAKRVATAHLSKAEEP